MNIGYILLSKLCIVGKFGKNAFCVFKFGADLDRIENTVLRHVTFNVHSMLKPNSQGNPFWCSYSGSFDPTQSYKHLTHTSEMVKRVLVGCFKTFGPLEYLSGGPLVTTCPFPCWTGNTDSQREEEVSESQQCGRTE